MDTEVQWRQYPIVVTIEYIYLGKGAKIATVIAKMDNFGTRNFEGAKPYTINQNGANLATPLSSC